MERFDTLDNFIHAAWHLLFQATVKRNDPLKTPVIGSLASGFLEMRTVVLRAVDIQNRRLTVFADKRSPKVTQLEKHHELYWLFWHPQRSIQIRAKGKAVLHQDNATTERYWKNIPIPGRSNYAAEIAPGTKSEQPTNGLPAFWNDKILLEQTEFAYSNFTVIESEISFVDVLHLHREGHQRGQFHWNDSWQGHWAIP